jgi:hypothetical protein
MFYICVEHFSKLWHNYILKAHCTPFPAWNQSFTNERRKNIKKIEPEKLFYSTFNENFLLQIQIHEQIYYAMRTTKGYNESAKI